MPILFGWSIGIAGGLIGWLLVGLLSIASNALWIVPLWTFLQLVVFWWNWTKRESFRFGRCDMGIPVSLQLATDRRFLIVRCLWSHLDRKKPDL